MGSEKGKGPEYRIDFLKSASAELARVPPKLLRDIADAIENLKRDPEPPGHIALPELLKSTLYQFSFTELPRRTLTRSLLR